MIHRRQRRIPLPQTTQGEVIETKPWLEILSNWVSIIGGIASIILAIWALRLTYRYGENTEQIEKLKTIASKQQTQLGQLQAILIETRKQTGLATNEITQIVSSNKELSNQTVLLSKQVDILTSEQHRSNQLRTLSRKASYMKLKNCALLISELNTGGGGLVENNRNTLLRRTAIDRVEELLEGELGNTYLLENEPIAKEWAEAYSWARIVKQSAYTPDEGWYRTTILAKDGSMSTTPRSTIEVEKEKLDMFNLLVSKCFKLYFHIVKDLVWNNNNTTGVF